MCERVSPKKTWEGFAGGTLVTIGAGVALYYITDTMAIWEWIGMAIVVVATATLGDLIESTMKREMQIKDSGNILPGHGGMLDRFDSTLLATPSVIAYLALVGVL
jgi:phosphatidate cytidylyltransferase